MFHCPVYFSAEHGTATNNLGAYLPAVLCPRTTAKLCYWLFSSSSSSSSSLLCVLTARLALAAGTAWAWPCDTGIQHCGFSVHVVAPKLTLASPLPSIDTTFPVLPITYTADANNRPVSQGKIPLSWLCFTAQHGTWGRSPTADVPGRRALRSAGTNRLGVLPVRLSTVGIAHHFPLPPHLHPHAYTALRLQDTSRLVFVTAKWWNLGLNEHDCGALMSGVRGCTWANLTATNKRYETAQNRNFFALNLWGISPAVTRVAHIIQCHFSSAAAWSKGKVSWGSCLSGASASALGYYIV